MFHSEPKIPQLNDSCETENSQRKFNHKRISGSSVHHGWSNFWYFSLYLNLQTWKIIAIRKITEEVNEAKEEEWEEEEKSGWVLPPRPITWYAKNSTWQYKIYCVQSNENDFISISLKWILLMRFDIFNECSKHTVRLFYDISWNWMKRSDMPSIKNEMKINENTFTHLNKEPGEW